MWELEQHVIRVTAEQIGMDAHQILPGSRLLEDLGVAIGLTNDWLTRRTHEA